MHEELPELKSSYYPPRAGLLTSLTGWALWLRRHKPRVVVALAAPVPWRRAWLALLVPGMGFAVYGRRRLGRAVFGAWALAALSMFLLLGASPVLILIFQFDPVFAAVGVMIGLHSMSASYFAQRCCGWEAPRERVVMSVVITGVLLLGVYRPLVRVLESSRPQPSRELADLRVAPVGQVKFAPALAHERCGGVG